MRTEVSEFLKNSEQECLLSCSVEENDKYILGDSGFLVGFYLSGADLNLNDCVLKQN